MLEPEEIEKEFEPARGGVFMRRYGDGRRPGTDYSTKKLCLVATDRAYLANTLLRLSRRPDCYYVKYSTQSKDGMYLGRCFLLQDDAVGELWQELKSDPRLMCSIQDDAFTERFRRPPR